MYKSSINAAIIIIGDEILSGSVLDQNTPYLAKLLNSKGIKVAEVRMVADIEDEIVTAVRSLSAKYDYIFTTGGIGPTHDDITSKAVAVACDREYVLNEEALKLMHHFNDANNSKIDLSGANKKMAYMPAGAELLNNPVSGAPGFKINNIYVLPGVPYILKPMFPPILDQLRSGASILTKALTLFVEEGNIAEDLARMQEQYAKISIGCYPQMKIESKPVTKIVISTDNQEIIDLVYDQLVIKFKKYKQAI